MNLGDRAIWRGFIGVSLLLVAYLQPEKSGLLHLKDMDVLHKNTSSAEWVFLT